MQLHIGVIHGDYKAFVNLWRREYLERRRLVDIADFKCFNDHIPMYATTYLLNIPERLGF